MNFRQLEAFWATMRFGNVTAAAQSLYTSQPSVSRLLADLEFAIGIQLFHHRKGRLNPTQEAYLFFDEVNRSFAELGSLRRTVEQLKNLSIGRLRVGTTPAPAMDIVPAATARFSREHPDTLISLYVRSSRRIVEWTSAYQLDIGIVSSFFDKPSVKCLSQYRTRCLVVVPAEHPLADRDELSLIDLKDQRIVCMDREWLLAHCKDNNLRPLLENRSRIETAVGLTACLLVRQGAGVAIVDPFTAEFFKQFGLVSIKLATEITMELAVIHATHKPLSLAAKAFLPILLKRIEKVCQSAI